MMGDVRRSRLAGPVRQQPPSGECAVATDTTRWPLWGPADGGSKMASGSVVSPNFGTTTSP